MADLVVVAASVVKTDGQEYDGIAGETVLAGQACYLNTTTQKLMLADDNDLVLLAAAAAVKGISLHGSSLNQPLKLQTTGRLNPGVAVAIGEIYVLSDTPGGICPFSDKNPGDWVSVIGYGSTAAQLTLMITNTGIQKA